jgi:Uma2 family endonuclease
MTALKSDPMTVEAFLDWCETQEDRYELVDGVPQMMTGARRAHDRVVVNAIMALGARLRGGPCEPHTADIAVTSPFGNVRRPDVTVDCERGGPDDLKARAPVLIIEVLSKSTRTYDLLRKTAEYHAIPSLRYILHIEPDDIAAIFHVRQPDGRWLDTPVIGRDTPIPMPEINVNLTLGDFYEAENG